jgi:hypothetical protein
MPGRILKIMKAINQVAGSVQYVGGITYTIFYLDMHARWTGAMSGIRQDGKSNFIFVRWATPYSLSVP